MNKHIELAASRLLAPTEITEDQVHQVLSQVVGGGIDWADMYFQATTQESWLLEEGIIKEGNHSIDHGVGVRAISGEQVGLAYSNSLQLSAIEQAAKSARGIVQAQGGGKVPLWVQQNAPTLYYQPVDPLGSLDDKDKIALLQLADKVARAADPRVKEVVTSLSGELDYVLVANSDGHVIADVRPLVRFNINVIVEQNGRRESASVGGGRRSDYLFFTEEDRISAYAKEAVREALLNLEAVPAPAGTMPVVLGPGWPGVLLHEAVGHGLEGDFNRKGSSAFSGKIGQKVASELCTVVDDGTVPGRRGSLNVDDEGTPTQCTVLIENGVLKGYMTDRLNAKLMNMSCTGNGRRESYADLPLPRMTNTYMQAGESDPEEIIASIDKGLYAVNFGGGQVDITSGSFVFSTSEAYLIENGKITAPVKDATLTGSGPDILHHVSMVGNDLALDDGIGTCGKDGQCVPVGVGQPTVKLDAITVGGTG